ncbi:MAG TPA: site-specific integrase, partial [Chloroflexota bacterium]
LYSDLLAGTRADKKTGPLSNRTVRYVHAVLKMALKQATRWRLVPRNVAEDADAPRSVRPQVEAWNDHEARQFLATAHGDTYGAIWPVALHTGLRKGELLALQWLDVDLERGALNVRRNVVETKAGYVFGEPKTKAGRHTITLPPACVALLRAHRAMRTNPLPIDPAQRDTALIFQSTTGTLIDQRNLTTRFNDLVKRAGVKRITFHGMRHTHATLLLLAGVNAKAVSARLGHASIGITLDTYAHVLPRMEEHAAEAIEQALARRA